MDKLTDLTHLFVTVFLSNFTMYVVIPAMTDVTMAAVCPGQFECSQAIYLTGFQQALSGLGSMVITPLIGNMSDIYGRKPLFTIPLIVDILPYAVLAYSRATTFYYLHYVLKTIAHMISSGSITCLSLAYVADTISIEKRAGAYGILGGILSSAFVGGTFTTRYLTTGQTFQVAAFSAMSAAVYMKLFLKESRQVKNSSTEPLLLKDGAAADGSTNVVKKIEVFKNIPKFQDIKDLLQSSKVFSQVAIIALFNSLADGGLQASLMYYLKSRFHFTVTQYANLMLIAGISAVISQLVLMPIVVPKLGEAKLLCFALLITTINMALDGSAWSIWVPYCTAAFAAFIKFASPCIQSIVSKQVGPSEQGKAQGCITGITAIANIFSPFLFSPLTALFLSDDAPFTFPGFSLICIAMLTAIAFIQSLFIRSHPPSQSAQTDSDSTATLV